jgi:hypothetical protein
MKITKITISTRVTPQQRELIALLGNGSMSKGIQILLKGQTVKDIKLKRIKELREALTKLESEL